MLTVCDSGDARVAGLDGGAEDCFAKPFSFAELVARLGAIARRRLVDRPTMRQAGTSQLDAAACQARRGATDIASSDRPARDAS